MSEFITNLDNMPTRETIGREIEYNTFDVLMDRVADGKLDFSTAVAEYRMRELEISDPARQLAGAAALQAA